MSWNYRVVKKADRLGNYFEIHEVYYDDNGNPNGWTEDAIKPYGVDLDDLRWVLEHMVTALDKPVLEIVDEKLVEVKL